MTHTNRERFTVTLEANPDPHGLDGARRLARVLKYALRACGLKCVRVAEERPVVAIATQAPTATPTSAGPVSGEAAVPGGPSKVIPRMRIEGGL